MKKLLCFLTITACSMQLLFAQNKIYRYYFNENFQPATKERAVINVNGTPTPQGFRAAFINMPTNKLLAITVYTDSTLSVRNGPNTTYHPNGRMKEKSNYVYEKYNGPLLRWDTAGRLLDSNVYAAGHALYKKSYSYTDNGGVSAIIETDSTNDTFNAIYYDSTNQVAETAAFTGNTGLVTYYTDGTASNRETVHTREITAASFPGGAQAWRRFLEKSLSANVLAKNGATGGACTVKIGFTVNEDGHLSNYKVLSTCGYGTEEEALRVIKKSPAWVPANRFGKIVKAYHIQPVTFQVL